MIFDEFSGFNACHKNFRRKRQKSDLNGYKRMLLIRLLRNSTNFVMKSTPETNRNKPKNWGDVFFTLVNLKPSSGHWNEEAMRSCNAKFTNVLVVWNKEAKSGEKHWPIFSLNEWEGFGIYKKPKKKKQRKKAATSTRYFILWLYQWLFPIRLVYTKTFIIFYNQALSSVGAWTIEYPSYDLTAFNWTDGGHIPFFRTVYNFDCQFIPWSRDGYSHNDKSPPQFPVIWVFLDRITIVFIDHPMVLVNQIGSAIISSSCFSPPNAKQF